MRKDYTRLIEQYKSGKSPKDILSENKGYSKSGLYSALKKAEKEAVVPVENPVAIPEEIPEVTAPEPPKETPVVIEDSFLSGYKNPATSKMKWQSKEDRIMELFGDIKVPSYSVNDLAKVGHQSNTEPEHSSFSSMKGKGLKFWTKQPKTKKEIAKEEYEKQESERLALIQKIRLYMRNFPDLHNLDTIITTKKKDGSNDVDKFLVQLYTKKTEELEKLLYFLQFHTRNNSSEAATSRVVESVFELSMRAVEMILCACALKVQGLTQEMMADPDVVRCLKEIMIESSIHSMDFGPKTDLLFKLGTKIATVDTTNRVIEMEQKKLKNIQEQSKKSPQIMNQNQNQFAEKTKELEKKYNPQLKEKYSDL